MLPQTKPTKSRNSSKVNLMISAAFHLVLGLAVVYFAAREGLLGTQLKKIAVEMVKEKPPEKPKEPDKPKEEPKVEEPKIVTTPKVAPPREATQVPPASTVAAPPVVAPAAMDTASFDFSGGREVKTSSDPVQLYKGLVEYAFRSRWERPQDMSDKDYVAEVEVSVDKSGRIGSPVFKKDTGNKRWDDSVRQAVAATQAVNQPPPTNFPSRFLVRFDVQEMTETLVQSP